MISLLVTVFLLQLAIHLVNTVGASTVNNLAWYIFNLFPTATSQSTAEQKKLKTQFLALRKELHATSSQDEFAKWAKLRRQHDKVLDQLEKSKSSTDTTKATFDSAISTFRWLGTNGLRMFLQFWFQKQAMFWIPKGMVPYYAEWLLSFPRAPVGSISIQAWALACGAVILLVSDVLAAILGLLSTSGQKAKTEKKAEPMKVPAEKEKVAEKKEL